jgi:hypothetical protein
VTDILHLSFILDERLAWLFEKQEVLSIFNVVADCSVSCDELHISHLAFTGVKICAVSCPTVRIAVLLSAFAGKNEYERKLGRRADSALPLSAILTMNISTAISLPRTKIFSMSTSAIVHLT